MTKLSEGKEMGFPEALSKNCSQEDGVSGYDM